MFDARQEQANIDNAFPHIFVINLKHSAERRRFMAAQLDPLGHEYSFFTAVDGRELELNSLTSYARLLRRLFFGRDLTQGEMGCLLSHRTVYQHILNQNISTAIVLEDDVFIQDGFSDVIKTLLNAPVGWDVVRFLGREKVYRRSRFIWHLCEPYALVRPMTASGGAYGYLLNQKAARRLLECMQKNWLPVDSLHSHVWRTHLETFSVRPSPVLPDDQVESTIGALRFDKTSQLSGWQRVIHPIARGLFKLYELIGKRSAAALSWPRDHALRRRWQSMSHKSNGAKRQQ